MKTGLRFSLLALASAIVAATRTGGVTASSPGQVSPKDSQVQDHRDIATFKSQVELVTVDAVVLDGKGQPVRGLTAEDFVLFEDGKPQPLATFEPFDLGANRGTGEQTAPGPVATNVGSPRAVGGSFVLLVDDMSLAAERNGVVRTALTRFLTDGVRAGDELILATTSGEIWWTGLIPDDREDLLAVAARVRGHRLGGGAKDAMSEWEAYRITHAEGVESASDLIGRMNTQAGSSMVWRVYNRYCDGRVACNCDWEEGRQMCVQTVQNRAQQVDLGRRSRTRSVSDTLDRVVLALTGVRGRKSLLLMTEGFLDDTDEGVVREVAGRCREANIAVYSLDVRGLGGALGGQSAADASVDIEPTQQALMLVEGVEFEAAGNIGLAEATGGFAARNTNDIAGAAVRVGEESRVYYLLGYAPPAGKGPRDWRKVKVEVKRPGVEVRARQGYTLRTIADIQAAADAKVEAKSRGAKSGPKSTSVPADPPLPADVARALANSHAAAAIPLRAMAYALEGRPGGMVRTLIAVEADMRSLSNLGGNDRPRSVLNLSIFTTHRDTGKTRRIDQRIVVDNGTVKADAAKAWEGWLTVSRDLDLPPGVNQARIVVRDEFLGRLGAVTLRFLVPTETGLRVSTPLITDRLISEKASGASRPVLIAHRDFTPRAPVYCQFQVYGAAPRTGSGPEVESSYELREKGGSVLRRGEPSPVSASADGRLVGVLTLPVDGMPLGEYELVVRVQDKTTGQMSERTELLRIGSHHS